MRISISLFGIYVQMVAGSAASLDSDPAPAPPRLITDTEKEFVRNLIVSSQSTRFEIKSVSSCIESVLDAISTHRSGKFSLNTAEMMCKYYLRELGILKPSPQELLIEAILSRLIDREDLITMEERYDAFVQEWTRLSPPGAKLIKRSSFPAKFSKLRRRQTAFGLRGSENHMPNQSSGGVVNLKRRIKRARVDSENIPDDRLLDLIKAADTLETEYQVSPDKSACDLILELINASEVLELHDSFEKSPAGDANSLLELIKASEFLLGVACDFEDSDSNTSS